MSAQILKRIVSVVGSVALLAVAVPALPAAKLVGLVMPGGGPAGEDLKIKFIEQLKAAGAAADDSSVVLQRPSQDKMSRINAIRKLVANEAEVLVVFGGSTSLEAVQEARKIPVVFVGVYDPVAEKVVSSLDKPGQNATGVSGKTSLSFMIDVLQETASLTSLGVIYHSENADSVAQLNDLKDLAAKRNFSLVTGDEKGSNPDDMAKKMSPTQFVFLASSCYQQQDKGCDLSRISKPMASLIPGPPEKNMVYNLAADMDDLLAEGAKLTARVLAGEKPGQIPVVTSKKIEFTVNMNEAQALGIKVPFGVLSKATKVIK